MKKYPLIEKLAVQSLVDYNGELIFSKEKFAELIIGECMDIAREYDAPKLGGPGLIISIRIVQHFINEE